MRSRLAMWLHSIINGIFGRRFPSDAELDVVKAEFDVEFYKSRYPHAVQNGQDPFEHFIRQGWRAGYDPNDWFSTRGYLIQYPDVTAARINPFVHYILYGRQESRSVPRLALNIRAAVDGLFDSETLTVIDEVYRTIQAEFDFEYYLAEDPVLKNQGADPISHYITTGWKAGRNPNREFNTDFYLENNPDVKAAKINPFYHYLRFGRNEKRRPALLKGEFRPIPFLDLLAKAENTEIPGGTDGAGIVVPIYNNFDDVSALLSNLAATLGESTKVTFVDDCSSDPRIVPLVSSWTKTRPAWRLVTNEQNRGFAETVNRGIELTPGHVVVLNSDTVLPPGWFARLIAPILARPAEVGSVTPFSNNSSITGFPAPRFERELSGSEELAEIDDAFKALPAKFPDILTGVGFCLALNRAAIDKVGLLDASSYGKGYYEDTDWCQRAIAAGYRNVACGNLFIQHKVDSKSFSKAGRLELSEQNRAIFLEKFPYFSGAEEQFFDLDPLREIRVAAQALRWREKATSAYLIVTHQLGGGATHFCDELRDELLSQGSFVTELVLNPKVATFELHFGEDVTQIEVPYSADVWKFVERFRIEHLVVNGLHGVERLEGVLGALASIADKTAITFYLHDFHAVCPSVFLLKDDYRYCGVPEINECQECFFSNRNIKRAYPNIVEWRRNWSNLLRKCQHVVAFSPSSKTILLKAFPDLEPDKIQVITPTYSVDFGPLPFKLPGADKITLGVAGAMYPHKGSRLVAQVEKYARAQDLALRTVVIGSWNDVAPPKSVKVAGAYAVNDLPKIIEREQIDVLLFPSVCPETYSRTLSELFALKVPIVSLDVGAQGDRVSAYEYGVAVSSADPQEIVAALQAAIRKRNEAQEVPADA